MKKCDPGRPNDYDAVGNAITYTTRAGQVKTSTYDNRNRETAYTWSDGTQGVARSYDAAGRLLTLINQTSALSYSYDAANELVSETSQVTGDGAAKTVGYSYDSDGNRASLTYPGGSVISYGYTGRNQVATITADAPPPIASYSYDLDGNRILKTLENGTNASYMYDDADRLLSLDHKKGATSFARFDYTLNAVGNRTAKQSTINAQPATEFYGYDAIDQVTSVAYDATRNVTYSYDAVGNRTNVADTTAAPLQPTSYTTNSQNQYILTDGNNLTYDANGNLTSATLAGAAWTYGYDAQNRLTSATSGTTTAAFAYDARNRCVQRTINDTSTFYVFDRWSLIQEHNASDIELRRYVHGPIIDEIIAMVESTGSHYYHHDALGSTVALTDSAGSVAETYSYDLYGAVAIGDPSTFVSRPSSSFENRFLFTGRELISEIGLYDYRNRMYSQEWGRFLQTDPIRFDGHDSNLYGYVRNSSTNHDDPLGLQKSGPAPHPTPSNNPTCECEKNGGHMKLYSECYYGGSSDDCMSAESQPKKSLPYGLPGPPDPSDGWAAFIIALFTCSQSVCCYN